MPNYAKLVKTVSSSRLAVNKVWLYQIKFCVGKSHASNVCVGGNEENIIYVFEWRMWWRNSSLK